MKVEDGEDSGGTCLNFLEVETAVVRTLAPHLPGRRIVAASFSSRFVTPGNRKMLARLPPGGSQWPIQNPSNAAAQVYIVMQLDEGTLTVHLGMTGRLLLDAAPSKHSYGIFTLDTSGSLIYSDYSTRQFVDALLWNSRSASRLRAGAASKSAVERIPGPARSCARPASRLCCSTRASSRGWATFTWMKPCFAAHVHPLAVASAA